MSSNSAYRVCATNRVCVSVFESVSVCALVCVNLPLSSNGEYVVREKSVRACACACA